MIAMQGYESGMCFIILWRMQMILLYFQQMHAKGLQCLIDMCAMYSNRWRFKYGIEKSKCMIIGKSPFTCEPVWRLNDVSLRNVETMEMFNSKGNNTSHVDNRLNKCRQSFYGLNSLGMSYPGAAPEVQAHLYKSMSASFNLRHGMYELFQRPIPKNGIYARSSN